MSTQRNSTKSVKKSQCPYFSNNSKKLKSRETHPNLSYEATITVIPKSDKILRKKENYMPVSLMNIEVSILNKINKLGKQVQQYIESFIHCDWIGFILGMQGWFSYLQIHQCDTPEIYMEPKKTLNNQSNLENKEKSRRHYAPWI